MDATPYIERVLEDEGIIAGLDEPEAEMLVAWLVVRAQQDIAKVNTAAEAEGTVTALRTFARAVNKKVAGSPEPSQKLQQLLKHGY